MHYAMAIDTNRCTACYGCAVACKQANNLPNNVWWNRMYPDGEETICTGTHPNVKRFLAPMSCQHCEDPACVRACPTGASYVVEDSNIVLVNAENCIGCNACVRACPYDVRVQIDAEPEWYNGHAFGEPDAPTHVPNTVGKCTFCSNRLARGLDPACMLACQMRARVWGDLDDPESDVSKALVGREYDTILPEAGTKPSVFYLK